VGDNRIRPGKGREPRANGAAPTVWIPVRELRKQAGLAASREAWDDAVVEAVAPSADAAGARAIGVAAIWNQPDSLRDASRSSRRCGAVAIGTGVDWSGKGGWAVTFSSE